jgi:hypothetical protein
MYKTVNATLARQSNPVLLLPALMPPVSFPDNIPWSYLAYTVTLV